MKKIISAIIAIALSAFTLSAPVFAADTCVCPGSGKTGVPTAILGEGGCYCEDEEGGGVMHIISLVVNIMSIGVGVLGVVGVSIVGIQYLTAGGNEDQTRKAKRRLFEIVIGLVAYALVYALMVWFAPGFKPLGA